MRWMTETRRALAGGVLLAMAAAPTFAAPPEKPQAPRSTPETQATAPTAPAAAPTEETARRISAAEARQALAEGKAVLVDVRPKEAYDMSHAQGAISLPLSDLGSRSGELPKDKLVIAYCT
jgi:3-mercaptopyruvate sulfurtransferase SseA